MHLGGVHPFDEQRVSGGVGPPVGGRPHHRLMDAADPGDGGLGVCPRAECGHVEERRGAVETADRILSKLE